MSLLGQTELLLEMRKSEDPLVVTPLLEENQIGDASIDVRLGHEFIILRHSLLPYIDPTHSADWNADLLRWQERLRISRFKPFVLNPGQLVLGATLEYVSIPLELAAAVEGRSSWGRLGLIIATATSVGPGFKGCITLELVNNGGVPLVVYPGMRIAQLLFQRLGSHNRAYGGKYSCPTGPQFTRIQEDPDVLLWGPKHEALKEPAVKQDNPKGSMAR